MPAIYEVLADEDGKTLKINVRKELFPIAVSAMKTLTTASRLAKSLKVPPFIAPHILPWGFGAVLLTEDSSKDSEWQTVRCEIPRFFNHNFTEHGWKHAFGVIASIQYLLWCTEHASSKQPLTGTPVQAVEITLGAHRDSGRVHCYIGAEISSSLCHWIAQQHRDALLAPITAHMTNAYLRMHGKTEVDTFDRHTLGAKINHELPFITFNCPGDRCALYPATMSHDKHGYELASHNVDTPMQQLVLLMGVASLLQQYKAASR